MKNISHHAVLVAALFVWFILAFTMFAGIPLEFRTPSELRMIAEIIGGGILFAMFLVLVWLVFRQPFKVRRPQRRIPANDRPKCCVCDRVMEYDERMALIEVSECDYKPICYKCHTKTDRDSTGAVK